MLDKIISTFKLVFIPCQENSFKPRVLENKFLYYYVISLVVLKVVLISFWTVFPSTPFFADVTKTQLIQLANQDRQEQGVQPLQESLVLDQAALLKANDMLANNYFSHNSPTGVTPWDWFEEAGYNFRYAGENLAIGYLDSGEVNQAWLNSPSHRENILDSNYTQIGMAVVKGEFQGGQTTVVVQMFGTPKPQAVVTESAKTSEPSQITQITQVRATDSAPASSAPAAVAAQKAENTSTGTAAGSQVAAVPGQAKEVLSAATEQTAANNGFAFNLLSFLNSDYYNSIQKIIYSSLFCIIFILLATVVFDIFIYKAYEIQYKGVFVKTFVLCGILLLLFSIDKTTILSLFPHNLGIY